MNAAFSGMQYTQRILQRSVTLIRRLLCTRPNESMRDDEVDVMGRLASALTGQPHDSTEKGNGRGHLSLHEALMPGWTHSSVPSARDSRFQIGTTSLSVSIS